MTQTELRELDAWIADNVIPRLYVIHEPIYDPFGYYRENARGYTNLDGAWRVTKEVAEKHACGHDAPDRVVAELELLPYYTTDPAAAMMVLERCYGLNKTITSGFYDGRFWFAIGASSVVAESATLPLAICLFARRLFETTNPTP